MADDIEINIGSNPAGVEAGSRRASSAVKGVKSEADQLQESFRRLKTMIDPTFAAQEKYNRSLAEARSLFAAGVIGGREFGQINSALQAQLRATTAELQKNSAAGRQAAAEAKATRDQQVAEGRAAAEAEKLAAREVAAAKRQAARDAAAAAKQAADEEKAAIKEAARVAKQEAQEAATVAKAAAREKAAVEKAASKEAAEAEKQAKRDATQAAREAATAAATAAKQKAAAERIATTAARDAAEAARRLAIAERQAANATNELRASIDPVFASQQRYNQTMQTATQLLMQNKLTQGEWTAIQKQARAQMELNTRSLGRQNTMYVQLGYQAQDVTASLASGINPLVILAQQGGQTAAAMSQMGGTVGKVAAFFAGPWGAAIIGATLLLGFLMESNKKATKATLDLMDAESRRKASLKELTEAIDQFNKSQREANTLEAESLRLKGQAINQTIDEANKKLQDAQKRLSDLNAQFKSIMENPSEGSEGALMVLGFQISSAEKKVKELRTELGKLRQGSQGELEITGAMRDAEAQTDASKKATQDYEHTVDGLNNAYREARRVALAIQNVEARNAALVKARTTLTQGLAKALVDLKTAQDAASASTRSDNEAQRDAAQMTQFGNPLASMTTTSPFGMRNGRMHQGEDLRAPVGTPVMATAPGTVKRADGADKNGYGNLITINVGGGTETRFGHLSRMLVKPGDTVNTGDVIGYSGGERGAPGAGDSRAPHLHYEVRRKGKPVDPSKGSYVADPGAGAGTGASAAAQAEAERKKALEAQLEDYDYQRQMAEDDYASQVAIQNKKIEAIKAYYGENSRETVRAQRELLTMEQRHNKEVLKLKQQAIQAQQQLDEIRLNSEKEGGAAHIEDKSADISFKQDTGQIGPQEALRERRALLDEQYAMEVDFENRMYQLKLKSLQDQMALLPPQSTERIAFNQQIEQLEVQHQATMTGLQRGQIKEVKAINMEIAQNTLNKYKQITDTVGQGLSSMFQGLWTHSQSFLQGLVGLADQVVYKFVDMGIKMLTDWAARQLGMTAITTAGEATRTGVVVGGEAAKTAAVVTGATVRTTAQVTSDGIATASSATSGLAQVAHSAAVAAARVYAAIAAIPVVGPFLAPIAAVGALAAVIALGKSIFSAEGGFGQIPSDGTMVETHKDEMILPAWIANPLRSSLKGAGPRGGSALSMASTSSVSTSGGFGNAPRPFNPTINYQAAPGESSSQSARNARQIVKVFKNAYKNREFNDLR